ncbi:MAG: low-specificity L-threonine aldolase, partial [Phycisphaeraceae bacterium]|nr:low-specificity L-threonine aldolase [Phycisphaeraceae bacterium]
TIDLRSDTVTLPTPAMRDAMAQAELGDDVFGEDPTTIQLEQKVAALLGKEAGLLVPSGTMANLIGVLTHCGRGDEVILGNRSHTFLYEAGGISALGSVHPHALPNSEDGTLDLQDIESAIRQDNVHFPRTRLICLENTQNQCGGRVLQPEYMSQVRQVAKTHQLKIHLDGARLFNAAVALGLTVKALAAEADSVSVCLSKGLAAPVGSVLCGSQPFIHEARRTRKLLGGGMRQCGIIAGCGIVALDQMVNRLAEDHALAQELARGIAQIPGLSIQPDHVETNIVFFEVARENITAAQIASELGKKGVQLLALGPHRLRAVTHFGIEAQDITTSLDTLRKVMA